MGERLRDVERSERIIAKIAGYGGEVATRRRCRSQLAQPASRRAAYTW